MVTKFLFKQIDSYMPDLTLKEDNVFGGIRLIYNVYKVNFLSIFRYQIPIYKQRIDRKIFLRPFKRNWEKNYYRLPPVYWGKKSQPLTRLWVILSNNYPLGKKKLIVDKNLSHQHIELFNYKFRSKELNTHLFNKSIKFYLTPIKNVKRR